MNKFLVIISVFFISILTTGCNQYISASQNGQEYYGAYNRRDMIHADV